MLEENYELVEYKLDDICDFVEFWFLFIKNVYIYVLNIYFHTT
jgi:hypothetical protein